jgi:hypothetical protein
MDNIGFYSGLGFVPGRLTLTVSLDAAAADRAPLLLGRLPVRDRADAIAECHELADRLLAGYDFTREIVLTDQLALGDTVLLRESGALVGFALCHSVPLVEGRVREELRVLKLVLAHPDHMPAMARQLADYARRSGTRRAAIRVQGEYPDVYASLIGMRGRVRWTDLRMTYGAYGESRPTDGVVLSNWEI